MKEVDRVEEEVLAAMEASVDPGDCYFKNALEYEGNLSPDWVERALYMVHPELVQRGQSGPSLGQSGASPVQSGASLGQSGASLGQSGASLGQSGANGLNEETNPVPKGVSRRRKGGSGRSEKGRGLSMTRRKGKGGGVGISPKWAMTRRRTVREREPILLDARE
jgi:hypothetical protein